MKIAYVTTFDLKVPEGWPKQHLGLYGAAAKIIQALETAGSKVSSLCTLERKRSPITRLKWQFYRDFRHKDFYSWADPLVSKHYARQIQRNLYTSNADILLCPENAISIAEVKPDRPMVLWTDAPIGSLIDFYPYLSNLCLETRQNLLRMEGRALSQCSSVILTSQWAAEQAHSLYNIPLSKIKVIPRGSNQSHRLSDAAVFECIEQRPLHPCQLLFIGVEWYRKGGDKALQVAQTLNDNGIETELHVVGCFPPYDVPDFVKLHGFIDRTVEEGQTLLTQLFQTTHFLLFPTRADTFGVVLSEAASYGVPALASDVGGISSVVQSRTTGETFPLESDLDSYCKFVAEYVDDISHYQALARSTFEHFKGNMSWDAAGEKATTIFEGLLSAK